MIITLRPLALAAALSLVASPASAQQDGPGAGNSKQFDTVTRQIYTLSGMGSQTMGDAVIALAVARKQTVTVAIVDAGGNLLYFRRMDGAGTGTIQAAIGKAKSALALEAPTQAFSDMAKRNLGLALGFLSSDFTILGGGQPIRINGMVIGGIAVSGGAGGEDDLYNNAGLAAIGATLAD